MIQRIAIHSVPRSGSTWLGSIFDSHPNVAYRYQPLFSYAFKERLTLTSATDEILSFFDDIRKSTDDFINQTEEKKKGIVPSFKKEEAKTIVYKEVRYHHILSNMLERDAEIKVVGLVRNPLSTLHSWLKAPKEFRPDLDWKIEEEWQYAYRKNANKPEEFNGYEKWKEVALLFEALKIKYPDRFYLLQYKNLLKDTSLEVKSLFDFVGLDYLGQTEVFLKRSREKELKDPYSVFKSRKVDDDWQNGFPRHIIDYIINDLNSTSLKQYLD